jgi:hypothetical protein
MADFRAALTGVLLMMAIFSPGRSQAQMPFYTDDTSTTGQKTIHVEVFEELDGLQSSRYPNLRQYTTNLKINFSPISHLELDMDAPYIDISRAASVPSARGLGDADLGAKYTFRDTPEGTNLTAFAASLYIELPTGSAGQGLGSGLTDYWLNFIAQKPLSDATRFNVNVGILFAGNTSTGAVGIQTRRGQVYTGGLSVLHDVNSRVTLGIELYGGISDGAGSDRSQLQALAGVQYLVRPGLSMSLGMLGGRYGATPRIGGQIGVSADFLEPPKNQPSLVGEPR